MSHKRHHPPDNVLKDIDRTDHKELSVEERQLRIAEETLEEERHILQVEQASMGFLSDIDAQLHHNVTGFFIQRSNTMTPLDPGASPVFTATPTPAGAVLPPGNIPTWTSSDPTVTLAVDATGLVVTATISSTATVGASITLTITAAVLADGTIPTGSITF